MPIGSAEAILIFAVMYLLPAFFILRDRRVKLFERVLWLFATIVVSWLAFLAFLWIAPLFGAPSEREPEESLLPETPTVGELEEENGAVFEATRKTLKASTIIAAMISSVLGLSLYLWMAEKFDGQNGIWFFVAIPLLLSFALIIPGAMLIASLAIKLLVQVIKK